ASVTLLEAHLIGHGGSGRNVGLVNAGLWLPPESVIKRLGQAAGQRLNTALAAAPAQVFDLIEKHGIDCEPQRNGTLHLAQTNAGLANLRDRLRQQQALSAPVALLTAKETAQRVGSNAFYGALHDARAGTVQPLNYLRGLARAAIDAGAELHENSPVLALRHMGDHWRVILKGGDIRARRLLIATNAYHTDTQGQDAPECSVVNYFQLATAPLGDEG
ncbi:MAG: FAD-dependent oxidoreductase, partial [Alteraurantiacibacter sp. bin_em_oilr2.035]|nr:FAD-dependent oxidoreductase [Alteraurantiacibacter sp. bin_em_oilr2.035]